MKEHQGWNSSGPDVAGGEIDGELFFAGVAEVVVVAVFHEVDRDFAGVVALIAVAIVAVEFL